MPCQLGAVPHESRSPERDRRSSWHVRSSPPGLGTNPQCTGLYKHLVPRFRWVACQLDCLCELPNDAVRRKDLQNLPPTLFATYERILERVNQRGTETSELVQATLIWLLNEPKIETTAFCEALTLKDGTTHCDIEAVPDEEEILISCGSLVHKSVDEKSLEVSHLTVKEYFRLIDSSKNNLLAPYSVLKDPIACGAILVTKKLRYLNLQNLGWGLAKSHEEMENRQKQYPFRKFVVNFQA
ncbi:hypothetical protein IWZ03DRAFT_391010 [Phyllosticta citriasiana]|uniref:Uncharacterized protein n=1 Tax=Phyllosticta citriasiana TaxID=595635 RepID=A0ABR1K7I2_9PEZI